MTVVSWVLLVLCLLLALGLAVAVILVNQARKVIDSQARQLSQNAQILAELTAKSEASKKPLADLILETFGSGEDLGTDPFEDVAGDDS